MYDGETIFEFNVRLCDIVNSSFALGGNKSDEKLVRKILKSLPKRLDIKVTTIEKAQNVSPTKVDEFIDSLLTFEMTINDKSEKRSKGVTFKVDSVDCED